MRPVSSAALVVSALGLHIQAPAAADRCPPALRHTRTPRARPRPTRPLLPTCRGSCCDSSTRARGPNCPCSGAQRMRRYLLEQALCPHRGLAQQDRNAPIATRHHTEPGPPTRRSNIWGRRSVHDPAHDGAAASKYQIDDEHTERTFAHTSARSAALGTAPKTTRRCRSDAGGCSMMRAMHATMRWHNNISAIHKQTRITNTHMQPTQRIHAPPPQRTGHSRSIILVG